MFSRSFRSNQDQTRVDKSARLKKSSSTRDPQKLSKLQQSFDRDEQARIRAERGGNRHHGGRPSTSSAMSISKPLAPSPIVTLTVGREGRLFAAHEDVLRQAPFFEAACRGRPFDLQQGKRISLPDEEPEVFSAVLEYLYKGDYYPRLLHDKIRNSWELEDSAAAGAGSSPYPSPRSDASSVKTRRSAATAAASSCEATVYLTSAGDDLLRDTVVYCAADRYGLEDLKLLALRKQGLQSGIDVGTILRSAAYAYAHTPDSDSRLRAHYLALIIRCRRTFKRSGTMQAAMEAGGSKLFFDLFVAMCNHLDDVIDVGSNVHTPRTV
ncbi:uncharacterized protein DNG_06758 [Cephalotrichum gorgonifer]|uniref:BTB domain-containing protein n=1 Tax=Cephalotrichum gorgonifer TaxID=2041049 RepID=A0AAE8N3B3_9PEZI|nr:uncharacterized protein DNG_06758 [Cephalotrichum gorgonifer]